MAVAGPGVGVGGVLKDGQYHSADGGTSRSGRARSSAAALIRSKSPDMSAREVVQRIIASCRDAGPSGKDEQTGYGGVRPYNALVDHVSKTAPNPDFAAYDKWAKANGKPAQNPGSQSSGDKKSSGIKLSAPVIFIVGLFVLALVIALILVLSRRGKKQAYAGPPPGQAPYGGPPRGPQGQGPQQGPPPSFGPPPNQGPPHDRR